MRGVGVAGLIVGSLGGEEVEAGGDLLGEVEVEAGDGHLAEQFPRAGAAGVEGEDLGEGLLGLGGVVACEEEFGLGEAWMLAWFIGQNPRLRPLPWTSFTGFISERFFVCLVHAFITAHAVRGFVVGPRRFGRGVLVAMGLHTLLNFPIVAVRQWGLDPSDPTVVLGLFVWVTLFTWWAWGALARMEASPPEPEPAQG
mgnify:CR=1 FL=1